MLNANLKIQAFNLFLVMLVSWDGA